MSAVTTVVVLGHNLIKVVCPKCKYSFNHQYRWGKRLHLTCPREVCDADISVVMKDKSARLMEDE